MSCQGDKLVLKTCWIPEQATHHPVFLDQCIIAHCKHDYNPFFVTLVYYGNRYTSDLGIWIVGFEADGWDWDRSHGSRSNTSIDSRTKGHCKSSKKSTMTSTHVHDSRSTDYKLWSFTMHDWNCGYFLPIQCSYKEARKPYKNKNKNLSFIFFFRTKLGYLI
jgi:hypothetical protein